MSKEYASCVDLSWCSKGCFFKEKIESNKTYHLCFYKNSCESMAREMGGDPVATQMLMAQNFLFKSHEDDS